MNAERKSGFLETLAARPARMARALKSPRQARERLIVVGNGMVSHRLCTTLARLGALRTYDVTVLGDEPYLAYDRVHLSRYVTGREKNKLRLAPRDWYSEHGITLKTTDKAVSIDRNAQTVTTSGKNTLHYDKLVFATGAYPVLPPIPGLDSQSAYVYRTISDLEAIKAAAANASRVAILGGGLLGLEAAQALKELGLDAHIVENALYLMPRQLDEGGATLLRRAVEALGIKVSTDKATLRIEKGNHGVTLHFADESTMDTDMIVVAAGVRPRDELAAECGLTCASYGGIQVDDTLTTSDPNIFAIGDCVCHNGRSYGLVGPGYEMADIVVSNLMGKKGRFTAPNLSTRLKLLGVDVASLGDALQPGHPVVYQDEQAYRMLNLKNERLTGAIGVGPWEDAGHIQSLVDKNAHISRKQIARFLETGLLQPAGKAIPVTAWPDDAIVCNCVGVTCGTLREAAAAGANTRERICAETGATSVCGSCAPLVAKLIDEPMGATDRHLPWKGLFTFSLVALFVALGIVAKAPYSYSLTIQSWWHDVEALWRNELVKQITGYGLLTLTLAALALSLRKRVARFTLGAFPTWRILHALVGISCLVGLIAHTGFRFGENINAALMTVFVLLNLLGAIAGMTAGLEARGFGWGVSFARRWRRVTTALHIALFLPMPLLLALHVFAVYYF